ncbi:hypothetical protein [Archangium lipolyticum]|uniref:hypothetical protein n=1 Tax=Archangium lipolyticum TaxID=2970465 RepID=UPI00214A4A2D|nr:hypothetical protein [Archangium lipolyticum]
MATKKKKRPPPRPAAPRTATQRPLRAGKRPGAARASVPGATARVAGPLQYKVVELSTVDEGTLERTVNEWSSKGWTLDGVQFAMRESSKRPAMAFVFFTREGEPATHDLEGARGRLRQMSETGSPTSQLVSSPDFTGNAAASSSYSYQRPPGMVSAHERLAQLAGLDEPERPERGLILEPEE